MKKASNGLDAERSGASKNTRAGRNTLKRRASWRLSELYRLAEFRRDHHVPLDEPSWLFVLAATLACGRPGAIHIKRHYFSLWQGLDAASLESACRQCGLESVTLQERSEAMDRVDDWVREHGPQMFTADVIARLLQVTAEERIYAKLKTIGAIDETVAERKTRRKVEDAERKKAKRRAAGGVGRTEYLENIKSTQPWKALGISERTWYRRGKPAVVASLATPNSTKDEAA